MKTIPLLFAAILFVIFSITSYALTPNESLEQAVASSLQSLAWDTVNEGGQTATLIYKNKKPQTSCKISPNKQKPGFEWGFCKVSFKVNFEDSNDIAYRDCDVLATYDPNNLESTLEIRSEDEDKCIEFLGESFE